MISVVNTLNKKEITYDGKDLGGDALAILVAQRLVAVEAKINSGDPYIPDVTASLDDDPVALMSTLRHAISPAAPFAGYVEVSVNGQPLASEPFDPKSYNPTSSTPAPSAKAAHPNHAALANYSVLRYKSEAKRRDFIPVQDEMLFKVGLINSQNPVVRAAETAVSIATPGDLSDVRSPVRSTMFELLTPGGGGGSGNLVRRALGRSKRNQLRCPPGFENGGQFTDKRLSTCGLRLFDLPGFGLFKIDTQPGDGGNGTTKPKLAEIIDGAKPTEATTIERAAEVSAVETTEGRTPNPQAPASTEQNGIDISRIALINPVGELDANKREESITKAAAVAAEANSPDFGRLVRRDGTMLDNVVPVVRLADVRNSEDMEQGFMVTAITDPTKFADAEFQVLSAGLDGIVMVTPDGKGFVRLERSGAGAGSIRGMRRRWGTLMRDQDTELPGAAFDQLVQEAGKKLKLSIQYPGIEDPLAMVSVQRGTMTRQVRRWVYAMFLSQEAPMRPKTLKPWALVEEAEK